ncbi:MAG: cation-translocating P-type ATPase [Eubacteriales bacterium]|nr:cation-translocating P-type ATPase [Eubacteriales bacterium]
MTEYSMQTKELLKKLNTNEEQGLSTEQAKQLLAEHGRNELRAAKKKTMLQRFMDQFKDVMILILIIAALISFVVAVRGHDPKEFFEPVLILAIVFLNAFMGVMQESKAEKAMEALKSLSAPHARVVRGGKELVVDAAELVPGDIILVEAGDFIPADARLLQSASLKSEESALTGESVPSEKDARLEIEPNAPLGDRKNMLYSGCSVTYGRGRAVVTATGMQTEMGRIANLLEGAGEGQTPLQKKLADLGKMLGFVAIAACAVIFGVGLLNGIPVLKIFMTAVSLAVSAIPEGLPAIVTVVLSIGVERMAKKNAIIRRLPAVETLGSASVICSDKTGTLTQNRMTLVQGYLTAGGVQEEISEHNSPEMRRMLSYATLCCDGSFSVEDGEEKHIGDPTETSIIAAAYKNGILRDELRAASPRLSEIPFDSDRKLMTTVQKIDGKIIAVTKGAYDSISRRAVAGDSDAVARMVDDMSENALRVLAVAIRELDSVPENPTSEELEKDLTLIGLVGMIDPPRPEVRDAVAVCRQAGIKPVMITGDHVVTAAAIAKDLGIMQPGDRAVTGVQLKEMSEEELDRSVRDIAVYARVSPEDKIRIVRAWQKKDEIVAMTGDGVNDAPALKAADIGCAMGITGTDVAKGASAMTLSDDNFTTIVDAVREGRGIYDNIRKVVGFLLGTNIGEILTVFFAMILWHQSPLLSMQLLLINLATDSLPAIALGMEAVERDVMTRKPRPKSEGLFAHGYGLQIALQGCLFGLLTLIGYRAGLHMTGSIEGGQTSAFVVLALSQVVQAFNMRSEKSLFSIGVFTNKKLNMAALSSLAIVLAVAFIPPLRIVFELAVLPVQVWLVCIVLILAPLPVMEVAKIFMSRRGNK